MRWRTRYAAASSKSGCRVPMRSTITRRSYASMRSAAISDSVIGARYAAGSLRAADQRVVAAVSVARIGAAGAVDHVLLRVAGEGVVLGAAEQVLDLLQRVGALTRRGPVPVAMTTR